MQIQLNLTPPDVSMADTSIPGFELGRSSEAKSAQIGKYDLIAQFQRPTFKLLFSRLAKSARSLWPLHHSKDPTIADVVSPNVFSMPTGQPQTSPNTLPLTRHTVSLATIQFTGVSGSQLFAVPSQMLFQSNLQDLVPITLFHDVHSKLPELQFGKDETRFATLRRLYAKLASSALAVSTYRPFPRADAMASAEVHPSDRFPGHLTQIRTAIGQIDHLLVTKPVHAFELEFPSVAPALTITTPFLQSPHSLPESNDANQRLLWTRIQSIFALRINVSPKPFLIPLAGVIGLSSGIFLAIDSSVAHTVVGNWAAAAYESLPQDGIESDPVDFALAKSDPITLVVTSKITPPAAPFHDYPVPFPGSGTGKFAENILPTDLTSPIRVVAADDVDSRYEVVFQSVDTGKPSLRLYLDRAQTVNTGLPPGHYYVTIYHGTHWYGEEHKFGPSGKTIKFSEQLIALQNRKAIINVAPQS